MSEESILPSEGSAADASDTARGAPSENDGNQTADPVQASAQSPKNPAPKNPAPKNPAPKNPAPKNPAQPTDGQGPADAKQVPSKDVPSSDASKADSEGKGAAPEPATEESSQASKTPEKNGDFEKMVQESSKEPKSVKLGDRIRGKIVGIEKEQTFIDFGGRSEASIATSELRGAENKVIMREGDMLTATVSGIEDGIQLTLGKKRGAVNAAKLRIAFEEKIPVSGSVKAQNKGGFDVIVSGVRAFCPLSHIDNSFVEKPETHVGKSYTFRVLRWENGGRNIVVSRRAILQEESEEKAKETRQKLTVDAQFDGIVTRVQPFGAFVDIGGIEGLLHISRMGHGHIQDPKSVVAPGDSVKVAVTKIDNEGSEKERIALALADLGPDPWEKISETLHEGDVVKGKVARLTTFGAFVTLESGIDGLVHVSEIAYKRINDPKEVLKVGEETEVKVLKIDSEKRRLSLSIKQASGEAPAARGKRPPRAKASRPQQAGNSSPGQGPLTHTMADQLGALKKRLQDDAS